MSNPSQAARIVRGLAVTATTIVVALSPGIAHADDYAGAPPPKVLGTEQGRVESASAGRTSSAGRTGLADRSAARAAGSQSGGLPVTGTDVLPLTIIGLGAVGVGTVLVRKGRTRQTAS